MIFSAMTFYGMAHIGDDAAETVGADMGVGIDSDGWVGTMLDEAVQYLLDIATFVASGI